jgi:hypothetical protein
VPALHGLSYKTKNNVAKLESMGSAEKPVLYDKIKSVIETTVFPIVLETLRLLPDSIVLGTILLTMISLCKSYGILVLTMLELMVTQRVLASIVGSIRPTGIGPDSLHEICEPGFAFPNTMIISILETLGVPSSFPSPVLFFLTGVISYMVSSVREFGREIKSLGGDLQARTVAGVVLSACLVFIVFAFRLTYGCETYGTLFLSLFFGVITGILIMLQNKALFGRDGINILNLPMILTAAESGKPMYVCAPSGSF